MSTHSVSSAISISIFSSVPLCGVAGAACNIKQVLMRILVIRSGVHVVHNPQFPYGQEWLLKGEVFKVSTLSLICQLKFGKRTSGVGGLCKRIYGFTGMT